MEMQALKLKLNKIVNVPKDNPITTYKKLNKDMISPYIEFKYELNKIYKEDNFDTNIENDCTTRIYSLSSLKEINDWGGILIFECKIWGKCVLENDRKVGSEYIEITRKLEPKEFVKVMLYENYNDSTPYKEIPDYLSQTNKQEWTIFN